jgi:hypothetical protein
MVFVLGVKHEDFKKSFMALLKDSSLRDLETGTLCCPRKWIGDMESIIPEGRICETRSPPGRNVANSNSSANSPLTAHIRRLLVKKMDE